LAVPHSLTGWPTDLVVEVLFTRVPPTNGVEKFLQSSALQTAPAIPLPSGAANVESDCLKSGDSSFASAIAMAIDNESSCSGRQADALDPPKHSDIKPTAKRADDPADSLTASALAVLALPLAPTVGIAAVDANGDRGELVATQALQKDRVPNEMKTADDEPCTGSLGKSDGNPPPAAASDRELNNTNAAIRPDVPTNRCTETAAQEVINELPQVDLLSENSGKEMWPSEKVSNKDGESSACDHAAAVKECSSAEEDSTPEAASKSPSTPVERPDPAPKSEYSHHAAAKASILIVPATAKSESDTTTQSIEESDLGGAHGERLNPASAVSQSALPSPDSQPTRLTSQGSTLPPKDSARPTVDISEKTPKEKSGTSNRDGRQNSVEGVPSQSFAAQLGPRDGVVDGRQVPHLGGSPDVLSPGVALGTISQSGRQTFEAAPSSTPRPEPKASPVEKTTVLPAPLGEVNTARLVSLASQSEMHIGLRTTAFGKVEVHTILRDAQVGVALGSERGDLKTYFSAEMPVVQSSLRQQSMDLAQVRFLSQSSTADAGLSHGNDGQPQTFQERRNATSFLPSLDGGTDGSCETLADTQVRIGLSVHA
jgi:hypothetical protein